MRDEGFAQLNPLQREAVEHESGPLLILAGAGSGKTRTLTYRVAYLIRERGIEPRRILAVTFTNKAAGELRQRVLHLVDAAQPPWVSTFHSACARILRSEAAVLGYTRDFVIYDDQDQLRLLRDCLQTLRLGNDVLSPQTAAAWIDALKNRGVEPDAFEPSSPREELIQRIYAVYQQQLRRANALDFGDLLLLSWQLFRDFPETRARWSSYFDHILVDEYQDTNVVQYRLVTALLGPHRNLCVVGDEDQSIYRWRGAEIRNILDFEKDFPDARIIRLEENYRSTGCILQAASAVVANNVQRRGKTLWTRNPEGDKITVGEFEDDTQEARWVVDEVQRLLRSGRRASEIAIFYRVNAQSRSFEEALLRQRLPYVVIGGVRFFARAEVKDVLAYLRVLVNPADSVAVKRIVNVPPRGIGGLTVARIEAWEEEAGGFYAACRLAVERGLLKSPAWEKVRSFVELIEHFRQMLGSVSYPELAARIIEQTGYGPMLRESNDPQAEERLANLEELLRALEQHAGEEQSLAEFLEQAALVTDLDQYDGTAERIPLMTLHAAKGLEFPVVFMVAMEEGVFPHVRSQGDEDEIEEERRLCYVGMTRAREKLYLTYARERRLFGSVQKNERSRFVDEIPVHTIQWVGGRTSLWRRVQTTLEEEERASAGLWDGEPRVVYDDGLRVGARVRHPTFGVGRVVLVEGRGDQQKVTVQFAASGRKKLLVKFAGLEPA